MVDRDTFDRLMLDHLSAAHRFAIRLLGGPLEAEDLVQEAMLRAARNWKSFRGESSFRTWLFQILINAFRDRLRSRRVSEVMDEQLRDARTIDPAIATQGAELAQIVARHVSNLPPRQREVLVLMTYEQMSATEAAKVLGISEQNVRTNLHFARERLKTLLAGYMSENRR
ncbi:MAG TPA: sigma-70 family RNA polymerase sigma factor [Tepidisphaeraceae bacterium]|jgi:RNA polymerase sigma-70 factor (ECF subfamily)|nr:sigma-70 family RNA polymerase sigma factor [Tepidisphaeraceae bacterium]